MHCEAGAAALYWQRETQPRHGWFRWGRTHLFQQAGCRGCVPAPQPRRKEGLPSLVTLKCQSWYFKLVPGRIRPFPPTHHCIYFVYMRTPQSMCWWEDNLWALVLSFHQAAPAGKLMLSAGTFISPAICWPAVQIFTGHSRL